MKTLYLSIILVLLALSAIWFFFAVSECYEYEMINLAKVSCDLGDCTQVNFCKVFNKSI